MQWWLRPAEHDENTCRKDFLPSEAVDSGMRLEELERPAAEQRKAEGQQRGGDAFKAKRLGGESPPSLPIATGKVRDIVGPPVGMPPMGGLRRLAGCIHCGLSAAGDNNGDADRDTEVACAGGVCRFAG